MIEPLLQAERLLLHGLVDQAEQIYRRTLESDPRNAIAAVGLAKVALERDDFAGAYGHACHALEIDRDNPSALRLEARLSEVLSARGQPVERPPWLLSASAATSNPQAPTSEEQAAGGVPPIAERGSGESSTGGRAPGSERAVFARNRSMSDHQRMEIDRRPADDEPVLPPSPQPATPPRRGILRRLLGR